MIPSEGLIDLLRILEKAVHISVDRGEELFIDEGIAVQYADRMPFFVGGRVLATNTLLSAEIVFRLHLSILLHRHQFQQHNACRTWLMLVGLRQIPLDTSHPHRKNKEAREEDMGIGRGTRRGYLESHIRGTLCCRAYFNPISTLD